MDNYDFDIEQAIKFLADSMPTEGLTKPTLLHSVRVGLRLYSDNYSKELIIAGLLHDLVEDTAITIDDVKEKFGERVAKLVELNTKNSEIQDKKERTMDLITRSASEKDSAIIKSADILDNLSYYKKINNEKNYETMRERGKLLLELKGENYNDPIFDTLVRELSV